ncbi:hypothetical protein NPIL_119401 [Nephila pilipes]|uniref:Uncharacterized protein n=1 Tax=Nephila pilipes TaxID=299642 RepID=A0A8X6NBS8_NEPPI|nr:hypothetical protein NPIL_119401 [Nephila pilipes]
MVRVFSREGEGFVKRVDSNDSSSSLRKDEMIHKGVNDWSVERRPAGRGKSAAQRHRILVEAFSDDALSETTFRRM